MHTFLSYIFLGLSLAAPIGPINAAQLDKGLKDGFLHSWLIGIGSLFAEMLFMVAVYFGIVNFLEIPFMKSFLWSFGCFVLIYTGIESFATASSFTVDKRNKTQSSPKKTFWTGFMLTVSNPLSILFWLGIYGSVLANTVAQYDKSHIMLYSAAIILGLIIWDFSMAFTASTFRKLMNNRLLIGLSRLSGLSLIGFGVYFGYQAVKLIFHL
ncbi:LysE family translocator [Radiobacillus kanasensis]|uniref:LysE family transporter n=1 Tax=Radiobacillus kanasensis TaxID=2844358 RepID=UPI001E428957|nr:LysE family transporter [Radiobacillus kanasensis]UFT99712.1 LysE family translocator [Radiobacillus kanasensis]